jgi:hypothetical protein
LIRHTLTGKPKLQETRIPTSGTSNESRAASARAFVHSLNILVKYTRLYGVDHKRTAGQFETTWAELQASLPKTGDSGFLLGVSGHTLLLDGVPLETGQAERSFAQLLTTAGLASIHFSPRVTIEDFARLVKAFTTGGSKAQDVSKQIKDALGDNRGSIKINEVKFVAADPATGEISVAAQIAAQTLGPEFKEWLNDPQKLLQLIAAAEGSKNGGMQAEPGAVPATMVPTIKPKSGGFAGGGTLEAPGRPAIPDGAYIWDGKSTVPLQEEEVIHAIRLLTHFGKAAQTMDFKPEEFQQELTAAPENTRISLQHLLENLAGQATTSESESPLLMKAAEHMAIRFALDRYQKGEVRVNAVHQMMEHMSRQMDTLRQILKIQEDKMGKAGLLVESHADILDRMFWAEVPEAGKKSVLLSNEAPCVPPRNVRQFVELLQERGDHETADAILKNYYSCLDAKDLEPRKKTATGLSQLADLFSASGSNLLGSAVLKVSEQLSKENDPEQQSFLSAAFVRLSQEASNSKSYPAVNQVCAGMDLIARSRPVLAAEIKPRVGVENRLPEFIEEAIRADHIHPDLLDVLKRTSGVAVDHLADRFFRCMRREECDRMVDVVQELGPSALAQLREMLRTGQARQASSAVGLLSRLDVATLLELLPSRLPEWNRFYHDIVVRQIAYGAALDRGRTLVELLEVLDGLVLPQAVDEIGMSGDRTASAPLMAMAKAGEAEHRSSFVQLKAIESLGRLRESDAVPILREILEEKKMWKWSHHRELRVAAAQALAKIDPRYGSQIMTDSGLETSELAIAALDAAPACPWVRQRRYERIVLPRTFSATIGSSWGKSSILVRELSLGGGMGTKEDNLRIGSEANLEISVGVRKVRAQVLLRRARVNEVGFEIVNTDLESRHKLRRLLVESMGKSPDGRHPDWDGKRKI